MPEVSFSVGGERGSVDVLAWHPGAGIALVVEVKSVVPDLQATLHGLDRKARIGPTLARDRGWPVRTLARLLGKDGAKVARAARNADKLAGLSRETNAKAFACDATDAGAVDRLFDADESALVAVCADACSRAGSGEE